MKERLRSRVEDQIQKQTPQTNARRGSAKFRGDNYPEIMTC
jgi:hypothetical protein